MITAELLLACMPYAGARAAVYAEWMERARQRWVGDDLRRVAMWLAQIAHESGSLRYVRELASGEAYENRRDLGNTAPGDGPRYRGRGLLQVTGRRNYAECGRSLSIDLITQPELLETPMWASESAGWVWQSHGLGPLCDAEDPVLAVTKRLNGGTNGLPARRAHYEHIISVFRSRAEEPRAPETDVSIDLPGPHEQPQEWSAGGRMAPLLGAAIAALVESAPSLIRLFGGNSKTSERNARAVEEIRANPRAVEVLTEIAKEKTGAASLVAAAEQVQANPSLARAFDDGVRERYFELNEVGGGVPAAREWAISAGKENPKVWEILRTVTYAALGFLLLANVMVAGLAGVLLWKDKTDTALQLVTLVLQADIGAALTAFGFWLGSSFGSRQKDERAELR